VDLLILAYTYARISVTKKEAGLVPTFTSRTCYPHPVDGSAGKGRCWWCPSKNPCNRLCAFALRRFLALLLGLNQHSWFSPRGRGSPRQMIATLVPQANEQRDPDALANAHRASRPSQKPIKAWITGYSGGNFPERLSGQLRIPSIQDHLMKCGVES
jgi:hypothetical protein